MSFGFDEEIGGSRSALPLASHLYKRYGKDGVALILDEGFTGVDDAYGTSFARFGMAEKGAISLEMSVLMPGGHSSVPTRHTAIGTLALLLVELEKYPDIPALAEGNPMLSYLDCAADFGDMDKKTAGRVKDPRQWQSLGEELAEEDDIIRAFLATTQAETMIAGGVKLNALPEVSSHFFLPQTATFERITSLLSPLVASLNLTFSVSGSHASVANSVVRLDVIKGSEIEPAPLTPAVGPAFELMSGTVKDVWSDAVVSPSGMVGT
jgi:Gly-Xaa carboxypeptidase